jgi:hypothetical protein
MHKIYIILIFLFQYFTSFAQELNCTVRVEAPKNQVIDPKVFTDLENVVRNFMNGRKWSLDNFLPQERFPCALIIQITEIPTQGQYKANFMIQAQRPVYNTSYLSPIINYTDKNCNFDFLELSNLEFIDNGYFNNLSSLLSYYAYMIIGLEYETFAPNGGEAYFKKALQVINAVPASEKSKYSGWDAFTTSGTFSGSINRFLLVDNFLNTRFKLYRDAWFKYHYEGLDKMYGDAALGRDNILKSMGLLIKVNEDNPLNAIFRFFFTAKSEEMINLFSKADMAEKSKAYTFLTKLDPVNGEKYKVIQK